MIYTPGLRRTYLLPKFSIASWPRLRCTVSVGLILPVPDYCENSNKSMSTASLAGSNLDSEIWRGARLVLRDWTKGLGAIF